MRYAAQRRLLDRTEVHGQDDVDRVFVRAASAGAGAVALPKGMSAETARLVEDALRRRGGDRCRRPRCAELVGISRVSARRYLEHFVTTGQADVRLRYGSTGPPRAALPLGGVTVANAPAAAHALDVLALIARRGEPVPAAAIARDLGLPRSSVYHLLGVLVDRGYVRHLPEERRYGLGLAAYELGSAYQRQAPLERMARGVMDRLVDQTGHNAHLAVLHGRDVLYVIEQRAPGRPLLVTDVGVRLPAALTASGLAMLAALPAAQVRALYPDRAALVQRDGRGPSSTTRLRARAAGGAPARPRRRGRPRHRRARVGGRRGARPQRLPRGGGRRDLPPGRRRRGGDGAARRGRGAGGEQPERPARPRDEPTPGRSREHAAPPVGTACSPLDWLGRRRQTPIRSHGPQIANDIPRLAWMLTNRVCPSGLKVEPANSSPLRSTPVPLLSRLRAMSQSWPPRERPRT